MAAENRAHKHQLKPCPICGSTDLTLDNLGQRDDWFVNCNTCEIQLIANYTEAQAVALWNKRAASEAAPKVPVGHMIVPVEPTQQMLHEGCKAALDNFTLFDDTRYACERAVWKAMLACEAGCNRL